MHRRKVHVEVVCGLCKQKPKTTGHILLECSLARNVWALVKGKIQKCNNEARDFFLLFGFMVPSLDQRDLQHWAIVADLFGMPKIRSILNINKPTQGLF